MCIRTITTTILLHKKAKNHYRFIASAQPGSKVKVEKKGENF